MEDKSIDKSNYDVASISRGEGKKRANFVQDALQIDKEKTVVPGKFIRVFSDMFLKKEANARSYF